jgi:hypothetical protein
MKNKILIPPLVRRELSYSSVKARRDDIDLTRYPSFFACSPELCPIYMIVVLPPLPIYGVEGGVVMAFSFGSVHEPQVPAGTAWR